MNLYQQHKNSQVENNLLHKLAEKGQSGATDYKFFRLNQAMYKDKKRLCLRNLTPTEEVRFKYLRNMRKAQVIEFDRDCQKRAHSHPQCR